VTILVKIRIPSLKKDVVVLKLTTEQMTEAPLFCSDEVIDYSTLEEPFAITESSLGLEYIAEYARILSVLGMSIKDFETKVGPGLLDLTPKEAVATLFELYENCIMINPALDYMTNELKAARAPLPEDMYDIIDLLPDCVSITIKRHLYRDSYIDSLQLIEVDDDDITMFEIQVDELLTSIHELAFDVERVKGLKGELDSKIIGQSHAGDHLYAVVRRLAVGFRDVNKPPAVLLFAGPTGVGKTLMAKVATEYLFGSKTKFGRIDCAGLSEKHDVSKLIGAPPGYVGYPSDRGGDPKEADPALLYREINKMGPDGGVLLLDEIEKAHEDIWDTFLTIFDEGYVKTSVGNIVDLRNVIIIMTTNLGSKEFDDMQRRNPLGFNDKKAISADEDVNDEMIKNVKKTASEALRGYMKPELIGRITDVVPFVNLTTAGLEAVTSLEWSKARGYLMEKLPEISITDGLKKHIATSAKEKLLGARPVQRMVEQYAIDAIAEIYVEHPEKIAKAKNIKIDIRDNNGSCDMVCVIVGKEEYVYEVKQTLSED
jgi:ATP-dependent Clp protease ATP-binding subunit ClpA